MKNNKEPIHIPTHIRVKAALRLIGERVEGLNDEWFRFPCYFHFTEDAGIVVHHEDNLPATIKDKINYNGNKKVQLDNDRSL